MNRPESPLNRNLSASMNCRGDDLRENASDPVVSRAQDSPVLRPVHGKSPILMPRQKTSLEKTTGYDYRILRRERGESETYPEGDCHDTRR